MTLRTDGTAIAGILDGVDLAEPVAMLNLIRLRDKAEYAADAGEKPCSGAEAYHRYGVGVTPLIEAIDAHPMLTSVREMIGPQDEWDMAFVVHYPSGHAFLSLVENPDYHAIAHHRAAAVADSRLTMMHYNDQSLARPMQRLATGEN